jgi:lysophospholipid acyltransferase (LPLAT)-like uncharacterized protein
MLEGVLRSQAAQRAGAVAVGVYLRFALRTTRWALDGAEHLAPVAGQGAVIAAFWHECLPLMPALWFRVRADHPARDMKVLISLHRDGRFIADVMRRVGMGVVHGSSAKDGRDKGGAGAFRNLLAVLRQGDAVALTPDGPRGPARVAAGGVAQLAAVSGAPVLPCAARLRHHLRLPSWDRLIVPLPFGRGVLVCLPTIAVPRDGAAEATARIAASLTAAADRAEALCTAG